RRVLNAWSRNLIEIQRPFNGIAVCILFDEGNLTVWLDDKQLAIHRHDISATASKLLAIQSRDTRRNKNSRACLVDVVLHELALLASVQGEDAVVQASAADEEQAKKHAANAGTETVIVVSRSAPHGEAILQEVVIVLPLGASENIRNSGQP